MRFLAKVFLIIVINAIVFWALDTKLFPEAITTTGSAEGYFFIALIFGLLNLFIRPILNLITIPFRIITLGLFGLIMNGLMLYLLEQSINFLELFNASLKIQGLWTYLIAGVILALLNNFLHFLRE